MTTALRTSEWPTDPVQAASQPLIEYATREELIACGWPKRLIRAVLGKPEGTRHLASNLVRFYYRLDRVVAAEQTERVQSGLGGVVPARLPLAMRDYQLRNRGWSKGMVRRFLGASDATQPRPVLNSLEPLYAVERVREAESSLAFRAAVIRHALLVRVAGYCDLCRAKEMELYGTVLSTVGKRHERACREAGCRHPALYPVRLARAWREQAHVA